MVIVVVVYLNLSDILIKHHGLPGINKTLIPAFLVLVAFIQYRKRQISTGLLLMITLSVIYYVYQLSSLLYAKHPDATETILSELVKHLIIAVVASGLILRVLSLKVVTWSLLSSSAFIASLSIVAFFSGNTDLEFGGFHRWDIQINEWGRVASARIAGQIGDPNFYAQVLLMVLPLGLAFAFNRVSRVERILAFVLSGVIATAIICSLSRGAWLMMIVVFVVFLILVYRRYGQANPTLRVGIGLSLALLLISTYFLPETVKSRFGGIVVSVQQLVADGDVTDTAISGRIDEMLGAVHAFTEHPVLGLGANNYQWSYQDYSRRYGLTARGRDRSAHSLYLQILAEGGVIGFLLFSAVVFAAIRCALLAARRLTDNGARDDVYYVYGLLFGYVAYLSAAAFLHQSYPRYFWLFTGLLLGTLNLIERSTVRSSAPLRAVPAANAVPSIQG